MASKLFIIDSLRSYLMNGVLDLDSDTIKLALVTSSETSSYSSWVANTAYVVGDIVIPTSDNGHRYRCTVAGNSHNTTEPVWSTTDDDTMVDNGVTWEEYGGSLANNSVWADVSGNEVANGNGYTTGGSTISNSTLVLSGDECTWDFDDVLFTSLTKTMRYAFIYSNKTVGAIVNPLIAYILLNTTPANVTVMDVDYIINLSSSGFIVMN